MILKKAIGSLLNKVLQMMIFGAYLTGYYWVEELLANHQRHEEEKSAFMFPHNN